MENWRCKTAKSLTSGQEGRRIWPPKKEKYQHSRERLQSCGNSWKRRRLVARVRAPRRMVWKIERFTEKPKKKQDLFCKVFQVQTEAGEYHMCLKVTFSCFMGLFLSVAKKSTGCANFPVSLSGSALTIQRGTNSHASFSATGKKCALRAMVWGSKQSSSWTRFKA